MFHLADEQVSTSTTHIKIDIGHHGESKNVVSDNLDSGVPDVGHFSDSPCSNYERVGLEHKAGPVGSAAFGLALDMGVKNSSVD